MRRNRAVILRLRRNLFLEEFAVAIEIQLGLVERRFGPLRLCAGVVEPRLLHHDVGLESCEFGFRFFHLRVEDGRIDARDDLPRLHLGVEIGKQFLDLAGDLRSDLDGDKGAQRAAGRNRARNRAAIDFGGAVGGCAAARVAAEIPPSAAGARQRQHHEVLNPGAASFRMSHRVMLRAGPSPAGLRSIIRQRT